MHTPDLEQRRTATWVAEWAMDRLADRGVDGRAARAELASTELPPIDSTGIGTAAAWTLLRDRVLATAQPTDHPRYLAFVAGAASVSAVLADMAVSAAGVYAGSELEAGAVVAAERAALGWLAKLIGMPDTAHGAFVSGGTIANLSALVVARHAAARRHGRQPNVILCGASAHSSVRAAAVVMGCSVISVGDPDHPMSAADLRAAFAGLDPRDVAGVVATAGATNTGAIDDLTGIAGVCSEFGAWLHVDAAYGGAALLAPRTWPAFAGINAADSVTIDPHKWLFTPFDCGAVLYRDPALARDVHAQTAPYLDVVSGVDQDNPADYAVHLSRRARGLPLWMSLIAHGTEAYEQAVDTCLDLAEHAAARVRDYPELRLVGEPSLSVVLLERLGWTDADYARWSESARRRGLGLITPTSARGRAALRFCFVNPQTTKADVDLILQDLARSTCEVEPDLRKCSTVPIG